MDTTRPATPVPDSSANPAAEPTMKPTTKRVPGYKTRSAATSVDAFLSTSAARVRSGPMSPRMIAVALVATFIVGGLLGSAMPLWVLVLIGLILGAVALFALDRYGSRS